jgi:hypothetical protein
VNKFIPMFLATAVSSLTLLFRGDYATAVVLLLLIILIIMMCILHVLMEIGLDIWKSKL